jgi:hypothetical protein
VQFGDYDSDTLFPSNCALAAKLDRVCLKGTGPHPLPLLKEAENKGQAGPTGSIREDL